MSYARYAGTGLLVVVALAAMLSWDASPVSAQATPQSRQDGLAALRTARKQAAHRQRRIIMNNDGNDCRKPGQQHTVEEFLRSRTSPLVGSQVDAIFYCTGVFNLYTHRSDETELRKSGDKKVDDWAWELGKSGADSLEVMTKFGHEHGWEVFWSMRMNDTHDSGDNALLCKWKQDHPEYLMGKKEEKFPYGAGRWSAVNYERPEVRDKVFRILQDVSTRYDVDGLELDFYRHPVYFKPQMTGEPVTQQQCDIMTDLLRRVRAMTEEVGLKRGRPLLIAVRVPDSLGFAKAIGLDIERWLHDGLVDILVGTCYFHFEPWENFVALGKRHDVPVYACLSGSRVVSSSAPGEGGTDEATLWHNEAKAAWDAGVDGIYLFNVFNPNSALFRQLGSRDTLMKIEGKPNAIPGDPKSMDRWLKDGSKFMKW